MQSTQVTERREFELYDGSEEVRFCLHEKDRVEVSDEAGRWTVTIQDDGQGRAEISVLEGPVTLHT